MSICVCLHTALDLSVRGHPWKPQMLVQEVNSYSTSIATLFAFNLTLRRAMHFQPIGCRSVDDQDVLHSIHKHSSPLLAGWTRLLHYREPSGPCPSWSSSSSGNGSVGSQNIFCLMSMFQRFRYWRDGLHACLMLR